MTCKGMCKRFSACVDRDMTFAEEEELREHLRTCPECARDFDCLERMVGLLGNMPETDPGPDFYAAVKCRLRAECPDGTEPQSAGPLGERLRGLLPVFVLRPAFAAAFFGLAIGLAVGVNAPRMAHLLNPPAEQTPLVAERPGVTLPAPGVNVDRTVESAASFLADIPLDPLSAAADTVRLDGDPEFVFERYMNDPQRGLVPAESYGRQVTDTRSDAFITF